MAEKDEPSPPQPPAPAAGTAQKEKAAAKPAGPRLEKLPPYNVVLLDDDDHTYEYVIEMLVAIFAFDPQKAFKMAQEVDTNGRVIVLTTHKERAELKRDQITAYGADVRMASSKGSMSAIIEPGE